MFQLLRCAIREALTPPSVRRPRPYSCDTCGETFRSGQGVAGHVAATQHDHFTRADREATP